MKKYIQNPKITVTKKLKEELNKLGNKGDTYESILWRLIKKKNDTNLQNKT
jgi:hypothetical protein